MKPSVVKLVGQRLHAAYLSMVGQAAKRLQASKCFTSDRRMLVLAFTRTTRSVLAASSALGTHRDEGSQRDETTTTTSRMNTDVNMLSVRAPNCMERLVHGIRSCWSGELFSLCRVVKSNSVAPLPHAELKLSPQIGIGMEANCNRRVEAASGGPHEAAASKVLLLMGSEDYRYSSVKLGGGCMDSLIDLVCTSVRASTMDSISPRRGDPLRRLVLTLDASAMAQCRCYNHSDVVDSSLEVRRPTPVTATSDRDDESSEGRRSREGRGRRSGESFEMEMEKKNDRYQAMMRVGCCRCRRRCLEVVQLRDLFLVVASETDEVPSPFEGCSCLLLKDLLLLIDSYLATPFREERLQLHHMGITSPY